MHTQASNRVMKNNTTHKVPTIDVYISYSKSDVIYFLLLLPKQTVDGDSTSELRPQAALATENTHLTSQVHIVNNTFMLIQSIHNANFLRNKRAHLTF